MPCSISQDKISSVRWFPTRLVCLVFNLNNLARQWNSLIYILNIYIVSLSYGGKLRKSSTWDENEVTFDRFKMTDNFRNLVINVFE